MILFSNNYLFIRTVMRGNGITLRCFKESVQSPIIVGIHQMRVLVFFANEDYLEELQTNAIFIGVLESLASFSLV
jgi:hypothetical protein